MNQRPINKVAVLASMPLDSVHTSRILREAGISCDIITNLGDLSAKGISDVSAIVIAGELFTTDFVAQLGAILQLERPWGDTAVIVLIGGGDKSFSGSSLKLIYNTLHNVTLLTRPVAIPTLLAVVRGAVMGSRRQYDVRTLMERNEQEIKWRKSVEASLRQSCQQALASEARYRRLLETANEGILTLTSSGQIEYANQRMLTMLGFRAEELHNRYFSELLKHSSAKLSFEHWLQSKDEQSGQDEYEFVRKDQSRLIGIVSHSQIRSESGVAGGFFVMVTDLTDRRTAEEMFRQLTENIREIFWLKSPVDGSLIYVSPAINHVFGGRFPACNSATVDDLLRFVHPLDRGKVGELWAKQASGQELVGEYRIVRLDGQTRWILERSFPVYDENQQICRIAGIAEDITASKLVQAELEAAKNAAEAASRAKSAFLANLSHEIRTPLSAILGFSELLKNKDLAEEERQADLNIILRNGAQLEALITDILDLSKIEAGFLQIERIPTVLDKLISEVTSTLSIKADEKGIKLSVRFLGDVPAMIMMDQTRLKQILTNVIGNAIKFTEHGRVDVSIDYGWPTADKVGQLNITVEDTGCGIEAVGAERLFKPFSQVDMSTTRKFGGTGLGLALSRRLANSLGGDVMLVASTVGRGSTFRVSLEAALAGEYPARALLPKSSDAPHQTAFGIKKSLTGMRILLAEDAPDNQALISRILTLGGAQVDIVDDGANAVAKAKCNDYDVVLMDIQMPILDGYSATKELRAVNYAKPIIALTAHAMAGEQERSINAGCDAHLVKPVDCSELLSTVASYKLKKEIAPRTLSEAEHTEGRRANAQ